MTAEKATPTIKDLQERLLRDAMAGWDREIREHIILCVNTYAQREAVIKELLAATKAALRRLQGSTHHDRWAAEDILREAIARAEALQSSAVARP